MRDPRSNPPPSEEAVREAVGRLLEPQLQWKVEALNLIKVVEIDDERLLVALDLVTSDPQAIER